MQLARPAIAVHPRQFGRGRNWELQAPVIERTVNDDLKLFATTFIAGFLFVSILLA